MSNFDFYGKKVKYISIKLPVRYEDEDIPYDFPLRQGDTFRAVIDAETGQIRDWPQGIEANMYMKVTDEGTYILLDSDENVLKTLHYYVPRPIPNDWGDYIDLNINSNGVITNWPDNPDFETFKENW